MDTSIAQKENERLNLISDISKNPTTKVFAAQSSIKVEKFTTIDSITHNPVITEKSVPVAVTTSSNVANPKIALIAPLEENIKTLRQQKEEKESLLLNIRPQLEKEIGSKVGFLDELNIMFSLIVHSWMAFIVWLIWFVFLVGIEMLVLVSKINEKEDDYMKTIKHQMELHKKKLELFAKMNESN